MHQSTTPSLSQTICLRWASRQLLTLPIVQTFLPVTFAYSLSSEAVVMRQQRRWARQWRSLLTRSHKRTSMEPCRSCWIGTTSALQPKEITSKGTSFMCVLSIKVPIPKKSLETYLMILVPFPSVLVLCEMQSVSSRIWTRVAVSTSYDDNHYSTSTSLTPYTSIIRVDYILQTSTNLMKENNFTLNNDKKQTIFCRYNNIRRLALLTNTPTQISTA